MDFATVLAIILGVAGALMAIILQILMRSERYKLMRLERSKAESAGVFVGTDAIARQTSLELKVVAERLQQLETGLGGEAIAAERLQNLDKRLVDIEETLEPLKNRSLQVTSLEYQFLMFEIDRLVRDLKEDLRRQHEGLIERQRTHEIDLDRRMGTFRTIFTISLTLVGVIIAGFGVVIWFIGR